MTTKEVIDQIRSLPMEQQREVLRTLSQTLKQTADEKLSEAEIAQRLFDNRIISEIPADWDAPEEDFEPITIAGKPLSETILEDRN